MYYLTTEHDDETYYFTGKVSSDYFKQGSKFEFNTEFWTRTPGNLATKFRDGEITHRLYMIRLHGWQIERAQ